MESSGGVTNLVPQLLDHALCKHHILGLIVYVLQVHILRYH